MQAFGLTGLGVFVGGGWGVLVAGGGLVLVGSDVIVAAMTEGEAYGTVGVGDPGAGVAVCTTIDVGEGPGELVGDGPGVDVRDGVGVGAGVGGVSPGAKVFVLVAVASGPPLGTEVPVAGIVGKTKPPGKVGSGVPLASNPAARADAGSSSGAPVACRVWTTAA